MKKKQKTGLPNPVAEEEKKEQVIYLLHEGMYDSADILINKYRMNMGEMYMLAFPETQHPLSESIEGTSGEAVKS